MSYQLATMADAQAMEFSVKDYSYLPDFPNVVTEDELDYCNGVDDAKSFMNGQIDKPQRIHSAHYMAGWNWQLTYFFNPEFLVKE
jgi:hypothetical protein